VLPNLFVIGAGKSGTSSLHYYLDQHPDVYMSRIKHPFYFQRDTWRQRLDWYQSLFPERTPVRGESSPSYSAYPVKRDVPRRIHELTPDAKLIYVVRDPVDRLVAQYAQHRAEAKERRSLEEAVRSAIEDGDDPVNPYLCMSRYATQVEQYLEHFPLERIHVIDNVDLNRDRRGVLREAFRFLGVDDGFDTPRFDEVLNTRRDQVRFNRLGARLRDSRPARYVAWRVPRRVRGPVTKPLTRLVSRRVERPELSPELRTELTDVLRPEAKRLRELTGKPFASWSL
jgi:Sulfotransferase domain